VHTLYLIGCKKIKDIGNLKQTKILGITTKVYGLHLLKELEELKITKKCYKEMKGEIKKLKRINKKVKIDFSRIYL